MTGDEIWETAAEVALSLPGACLCFPFGPEPAVYMAQGKMFLLLSKVRGQKIATTKLGPEDSMSLRDAIAEVTPGYHMNKRHWVSVWPGPGADTELVSDLVRESFFLVST